MTSLDLTKDTLRRDILRHLTYTLGKDAGHASHYDWRMALSFAIRDRIVDPWFASTRRTWAEERKRVYYLSMEFLIGRLLEDATINLGLRDMAAEVLAESGQDFAVLAGEEPDAALGNGGLGRLAACYMESMATVGCPGYGYGIRYEHGLFRQRFEGGQQVETAEDWLKTAQPVGIRAAGGGLYDRLQGRGHGKGRPRGLDAGRKRNRLRLRHPGHRLAGPLGQHAAPLGREADTAFRSRTLQPGRLYRRRRAGDAGAHDQPRALPRGHDLSGQGTAAEAGILPDLGGDPGHPAALPRRTTTTCARCPSMSRSR